MPAASLDRIQFVLDNVPCCLEVNESFLHLKSCKKIRSVSLRSLSSFNKSFPLKNIISVQSGCDWQKYENQSSANAPNLKVTLNKKISPCYCLTIHVFTVKKRCHRKLQTIKLKTENENDTKWCKDILISEVEKCLKVAGIVRPKALLVFVNPYGGKKQAVSVHENVASPLFKLAGVKETVVITERRNHAKDFVESNDMSMYDGVIAVGGDGMINEIMNGVLIATQKKKSVSLDGETKALENEPIRYASAAIKIGLIPAGSTNCLSYVSQGNDDPSSATLQIICGESHPLNVCSIHDDAGKFIRFSFSMTSYGYFGHVLRKSENLRKLGPSRYDLAGVAAFTQMKSHHSQVTYLLSSPEKPHNVANDGSKCRYPCTICNMSVENCKSDSISTSSSGDFTEKDLEADVEEKNSVNKFPDFYNPEISSSSGLSPSDKSYSDKEIEEDDEECFSSRNSEDVTDSSSSSDWRVVQGKFVMVNSALMSCACARCPEGLSPSAHLSDGNIDLIFLKTTSRANLLRYLLSHIGKANRFDFPFVEVHRVKGFRHKALTKQSRNTAVFHRNTSSISLPTDTNSDVFKPGTYEHGCWNTDGEIIENPNIILWVHKGLINLFARGVE